MDMLRRNQELRENLSAVAHLIHGSSEERFSVTYCTSTPPHGLSKEEVEGVGYQHMAYEDAVSRGASYTLMAAGMGAASVLVDSGTHPAVVLSPFMLLTLVPVLCLASS